ncbi:MAG TPA: membrane protein insertase YidC [Xanthomonadaceae bacterium]|nr:membrane protein insertase YidC [Xanthomonadaceae bacterium]
MNNPRTLLFMAWLLVLFLLWQAWDSHHRIQDLPSAPPAVDAPPVPADVPAAVDVPAPHTDLPAVDVPPAVAPELTPAVAETVSEDTIEVRTDVLRLDISLTGGAIVVADLLDYPVAPRTPDQPVRLLNSEPQRLFVARVGIADLERGGPTHLARFSSSRRSYALREGDEELIVTLNWEDAARHIEVQRTYTFRRGSYQIVHRDVVRNRGGEAWVGRPYRDLERTPPVRPSGWSFTNPEMYSFVGAGWWSPQDKFSKKTLDDFSKANLGLDIEGGWGALLQHYFVAAWIPDARQSVRYETSVPTAGRYRLRLVDPGFRVEPGAEAAVEARLFIGPKLQNLLPEVATGLDLTVDYGIFTIFAKPLFWLLNWIHGLVGNWGLAIVLLTVLIKLAFFKLTEAQFRSMAKMRKVQPRLMALKERYGDDRQKMNQAMMELYKKEKINPLGGCLPILVQIPIFIALYWVLLESVELRQAPFFGWIQDLSAPDPYFILPVLNGLAMWATQKLSPAPGMDPMQQKIMQTLPLVFAVLFAFFQAGLVLYWTVNGVLSLAQQWYITRKIDMQGTQDKR